MSDDERIDHLNVELSKLAVLFHRHGVRLTALEAQLAAMRGTQSSERWAGDSPVMTIEPADERRDLAAARIPPRAELGDTLRLRLPPQETE